ncbi:uncharacterized protein MONBRDRAFT_9896 [Monosiga brevicollis MX1]|uniref:Uncharacterized protein n=1 Tax=Monosiga brevicollis TaxID=81824 RepID=A9V4J8_MONBE|nr:uncharacterized protein MONBRDRAFT_9896 [Monosiga brevicollis MX1]EDQ87466.1 predicted protein [Monosiga brevicollis MX1]|eukprot:XP_001747726.1 hypothetical protein [Monosiga brevicollis MX1]
MAVAFTDRRVLMCPSVPCVMLRGALVVRAASVLTVDPSRLRAWSSFGSSLKCKEKGLAGLCPFVGKLHSMDVGRVQPLSSVARPKRPYIVFTDDEDQDSEAAPSQPLSGTPQSADNGSGQARSDDAGDEAAAVGTTHDDGDDLDDNDDDDVDDEGDQDDEDDADETQTNDANDDDDDDGDGDGNSGDNDDDDEGGDNDEGGVEEDEESAIEPLGVTDDDSQMDSDNNAGHHLLFHNNHSSRRIMGDNYSPFASDNDDQEDAVQMLPTDPTTESSRGRGARGRGARGRAGRSRGGRGRGGRSAIDRLKAQLATTLRDPTAAAGEGRRQPHHNSSWDASARVSGQTPASVASQAASHTHPLQRPLDPHAVLLRDDKDPYAPVRATLEFYHPDDRSPAAKRAYMASLHLVPRRLAEGPSQDPWFDRVLLSFAYRHALAPQRPLQVFICIKRLCVVPPRQRPSRWSIETCRSEQRVRHCRGRTQGGHAASSRAQRHRLMEVVLDQHHHGKSDRALISARAAYSGSSHDDIYSADELKRANRMLAETAPKRKEIEEKRQQLVEITADIEQLGQQINHLSEQRALKMNLRLTMLKQLSELEQPVLASAQPAASTIQSEA